MSELIEEKQKELLRLLLKNTEWEVTDRCIDSFQLDITSDNPDYTGEFEFGEGTSMTFSPYGSSMEISFDDIEAVVSELGIKCVLGNTVKEDIEEEIERLNLEISNLKKLTGKDIRQ